MQNFKRIFSLFLTSLPIFFTLVYAEENLSVKQTTSSEEFSPIASVKNYYVDPYTGSANFTIPIFMPPARKTLPQKLNLVYSSRAGNGWLGVGWKLDLGIIERSTKNGYPQYDSSDKFLFSLGEQQNDLVYVGGQEYRAKTADIAWKFIFDGQRWQVKDNLGNTYHFGLDNKLNDFSCTKDPNNSGKIFRWRLSKITDTSGNNIIFKYLADKIEIYYSEKNEAAKSSYRKEDYNYLVLINFSNERTDVLSNYRSGFNDNYPLNGSGRISEIKILYRDQLVRRYHLEYKYSFATGRSILEKITEYGSDNQTANPPVKFNYSSPSPLEYDTVKPTLNPWRIRFADSVSEPKGDFQLTPDGFVDENGVIMPLNWSKIYTTDSGNISGFSWTVTQATNYDKISFEKKGNLNIAGKRGQAFHAWTYLEIKTWDDPKKQYNIYSGNNCNANYFISDASSQKGPYSLSQPLYFSLKEMSNYIFRIDIVGYNLTEDFNLYYKIAESLSFWDNLSSTGKKYTLVELSGDFNGDGITDLGENLTSGYDIAISNKRDFQQLSNWRNEGSLCYYTGSILLGDFNGDGKTDTCRHECDNLWKVLLSDGTKFSDKLVWLKSETWYPAYYSGDFNGDGLTDICFISLNGTDLYAQAAFSNGQAFKLQSQFRFSNLRYETGDRLFVGDFNGDGITDFGLWKVNSKKLEIKGYKNKWSSSILIDDPNVTSDNFHVEFSQDFNCDGKSDLLYYNLNEMSFYVKNLLGSNTKESIKLNLDFSKGWGPFPINPLQTGDFNGDGVTDFLIYSFFNGIQVAYSNNNVPDLLIGIDNGWGATLEFKYKASTEYDNYNPDTNTNLPFAIPVISEVIVSDGLNSTYKTTYVYAKGYYDVSSKEFRGFGYVAKIDDETNITETWFLQDDIYKGKISQQKISDKDGNLFYEIQNAWNSTSPYPGTYIVSLSEINQYAYDGDSSYKQKKTAFQYDSYGNQISVKEWAEVDIAGDEKETIIEYVYNKQNWLISYPAHIFIEDSTGKKVQERWLYYDGSSNYTTAPAKGLLTKEEVEIFNPITQQRAKALTQYNYDSFGNLVKLTDPLDHIVTTEYDIELHIYPSKIINALGHIMQYTYDPKTAQILTSIDVNNQKTTNVYDALGRLIKVIGPNDTEDTPGAIYQYDLTTLPIKITKKVKTSYALGQPNYLTSYSFYDGLGRLIQTKTTAENDPQTGSLRQTISDVVRYDYQDKVIEKYLPYFTDSSELYDQNFTSQPKFTYTYDCLGRLTQTTNPNGTYSQNTYLDWTTAFVDENGNRTVYTQDAYARTVKVEEYNGTLVYTTTYEYDILNNLVKITDDQKNTTDFIYDSLGRRLHLNDPDMGVWNYEYNLVGNLIRQTDANRQVLEFEYDALNRLTRKLANRQTIVTYSYDDTSKQNCKGRLSKVTDTSGSEEYFYDNLGRQIKSIKVVGGGSSFATERSYDALNRPVSIKYPDGEIVTYKYNKTGQVDKIINGTREIVKNVDYSSTQQITKIEYGNNTATDYTYDPYTLRINQILTQAPSGKIQDLNYAFDKVGNVNNIEERINDSFCSFLYDGINRLVRAQGTYGVFLYSYDSIGNIVNKAGLNYVYDYAKPHAVRSTSDGTAFEYDINGNLIQETNPQGNKKFTYDVENRLIKVEETHSQDPNIKTIQIYLAPGINNISLPFGTSQQIKNILSSIQNSREDIAYWDVTKNKYLYNANDSDFDQFTTLEYAKGYWIYISNPKGVTLTITGRVSDTHQSTLKTGWNAIGCPKDVGVEVETALKPLQLGVDYNSVLRYKSDATWQEYSSVKKEFTKLEPAEGYWIRMLKDKTWNINNTVPWNSITEFSYDSQGNRVKKVSGNKTTFYIESLYEKDSDGATRKHIFLGKTRISTINQQTGQPANGQTYYYHSDHLGSSNVISDQNGKQVQISEYTPFGEILHQNSTNALVTSYLFTGKELDTSTGLYYYGARYYNPNLARFTQPDPLIQDVYDPQTLNHYAYCRNNPLILTDPDGTSWSSTFSSFGNWASTSWNSFTNWTNNSWNSFTDWTANTYQSLRQTWQDLKTFTSNSLNTFTTNAIQTFSNFGIGLSNFGQSAFREMSIWGSALGMGMSYGANTIAPPGSMAYNILEPFSNTLTRPGYNYGMWMYGEKSFKNLFGASLDAAWAVTSIMSPIMGSSSSYYQYYGPNSNPNSTWVTRTLYSPEVAMQKLSAPTEWNAMRKIDVPWYRWVGGPRPAAPKFGYSGGGGEYKIGGFGLKNWIEYFKDW